MANPAMVVLGYQSKVKINGNLFSVRTGRVVYSGQEHEVGGTEDTNENAIFTATKTGRQTLEATVDFYENTLVATHAAPYLLSPGQFIVIEIFPKGLDYTPFTCTLFSILTYEDTADINQPVSGKFTGKNLGSFTVPSN